MENISIKARAKINLTLEVLGRRDDGYHEVAGIIQTIDLHDTLSVEPSDDTTLECDRPELVSSDNLVLRAAALLREQTGCDKGARMVLKKVIPVSAGLGGGSSDAAAALTGLNTLWGLGLSRGDLAGMAAELGSDVPFFLYGGTAMVEGRGQRVIPLPPADLKWVVVLSPDIDVPDKTATLYARLAEANFSPGELTRNLVARIRGGGEVPPELLFNAFDDVARDAFPGLDRYWETFEALGAREVHLAGSGPSLYAPVSRREQGAALALTLRRRHGWEARLASLWGPPEDREA